MRLDLGQSVTLILGDPRPKLPSDLSGSQSIWVDPPWREKDDGGKISALSQIAKKLLTKHYRKKGKRNVFNLTWLGRSTVAPNRSTHAPFGFGTSQAIRWSLSRSFITFRSEMARGGGGQPLPQVRSRLVKKEVRARVKFGLWVVGH